MLLCVIRVPRTKVQSRSMVFFGLLSTWLSNRSCFERTVFDIAMVPARCNTVRLLTLDTKDVGIRKNLPEAPSLETVQSPEILRGKPRRRRPVHDFAQDARIENLDFSQSVDCRMPPSRLQPIESNRC